MARPLMTVLYISENKLLFIIFSARSKSESVLYLFLFSILSFQPSTCPIAYDG